MTSTPSDVKQEKENLLAPFATAFLLVMFLFFIDEGYYDFRWMRDAGNWVVFFFYLSFAFLSMWLINYLVFRKRTGWKKWVALTATGFALVLLVLYA